MRTVLGVWSAYRTYGRFGLSPELEWEHVCLYNKGGNTATGPYLFQFSAATGHFKGAKT